MRIWPTKRGWKRIGIGLAMLAAIGLVVNGVLAWRAELRLRERLAAIRAAGDPASIAELAPAPIPDDQNAAAIMERIRPQLNQFSKEYGQFYNSPLGKQYDDARNKGEPATKEQVDAIRAILAKYADLERFLAEASVSEKFASRLDYSLDHAKFLNQLLDHIQVARMATRLLTWRGEVLLADGEHEQALENGLRALRLARLHENEPTLVAYLVAIAMRSMAAAQIYDALSAGPVSAELHQSLDMELAKYDDPQQLVEVMTTERAVSADWLDAHRGEVPSVLFHMFGWPLKSYQVGVLDAMEEQIELAGQPWYKISGRFGVGDSPARQTGHGTLAELLMPAVKAAYQARARSLAVSRSLRIYNALQQFAEKNGREATGLEELGLPQEAIIDPYSGEPLKFKHTDDDWIIYSVMENGVDDGGDFKGLKDYGVAPAKHRVTE
jgi:hypothetical protein